MDKLNWGKRASALLLLCARAPIASRAQTLKTLYTCDNGDGYLPVG
ncbi:MAG TPA: hypothetical protein VGW33_03930 [Terriglobia bacterium]|nr:hypothetical protein [Terriglobia bacterium]